ncbi:TPA: hypothetical protein ACH3X2_14244 [Trebouxia sp. C0005]
MPMCIQQYTSLVHINVDFIQSKPCLYLQPAFHPVHFESFVHLCVSQFQGHASSVHSTFKAVSPIAHCTQSKRRQFAYLGPPASASQQAQKNSSLTKTDKLPTCSVQLTGYPCAMCLWNILSGYAGKRVINIHNDNLNAFQLMMS